MKKSGKGALLKRMIILRDISTFITKSGRLLLLKHTMQSKLSLWFSDNLEMKMEEIKKWNEKVTNVVMMELKNPEHLAYITVLQTGIVKLNVFKADGIGRFVEYVITKEKSELVSCCLIENKPAVLILQKNYRW